MLVRSASLTVDDAEFQAAVEELESEISRLGPEIVTSVASFYSTGDESFVSADRRSTIIPIAMTGTVDDADPNIGLVYERVALDEHPAFEVFITGETTFAVDFAEQAQSDLERGEAIGAPIALGILIVVFGAVAAAFLPLVIAIGAIVLAMAGATVVSNGYDLHVFTQNVATMIGLAVGIDYSLFIVSRFREERRRGREKIDAIATAGATASRAVLVSGSVVVIALVGMLLIPFTAFFSVGIGAILVVVAAVAATLTLLPAALSLLGDNINRLRLPFIGRFQSSGNVDARGGIWDKVSYAVMRRPVVSLLVAGGALVALTIPLFTIETGLSGASTFPEDLRVSRGFAALQEDFGFGADAPVNIVLEGDIDAPATTAAIDELRAALAEDPSFGPSSLQVGAAGDVALIAVPVVGDPNSEAAIARVEELRDATLPATFDGAPVEAFVGGLTAETVDFKTLSFESIPIVLGFVIVLTLVILTVVFRSIVVPIKAVILNLLSVGASYGVIVLVFQHGFLAEQLGFSQSPIIQAWIPLFLFAVLFGLSMDYQRLPAEPDPRALRPDPPEQRVRGVRRALDGGADHRRGADHGRGLQRLRRRLARVAAADGLRPRGRGLPGRDGRARGARARLDAAARRPQLVPAELPRVAPRDPPRGLRARARAGAGPRRRRSRPGDRRLVAHLAPALALPPLRRCCLVALRWAGEGGGREATALETLWLRPRRRTHASRETSRRGRAPRVG